MVEFPSRVRAAANAMGLALAVVAAQPVHAACRIEQVGEIPVKVANPRILVDATLDGKPVEMIVDTGSPFTIVSRQAAERLGLHIHVPNSGIQVKGIGGEALTLVASVDKLSFGQFSLTDSSIIVAGASDYDGVVGRDVFGQYDVEIDLAHNAIRLLRPEGCSDVQMIYWGGQSFSEAPLEAHASYLDPYRTEIRLNGRSFVALLDTGAPRTTVTVGAAELAGVTLASPGSVPAREFSGVGPRHIPSFSGLFNAVGIGDEEVKDTRLFVADLWKYNKVEELGTRLGAIDDNPTYALIGDDFFRSHRVLISPSHHKLFFTYLGGPIFLPYKPPEDAAGRGAPPT